MTAEVIEERMGRIEAVFPHLATKEDIAEVKRLISDREASMLKWLVGITTTAAASLLMALIRVFV